MIQKILDFADTVEELLTGPWTLALIIIVALYLTLRSGIFQVRKFGYITKKTLGKIFKSPGIKGKGRMTPFQATATALASTVGMGNMAGVATAISIGGPGAIFWMWLLAFLGMMSKMAEITLAVHYRKVDKKGNISGGPMHYIRKGLGWKFLAVLFSAGVIVNSLSVLPCCRGIQLAGLS